MKNSGKSLNLAKKINISGLKKLNKHIIENFDNSDPDKEKLEIDKDIHWVDGFMCAVWSSPNLVRMDDWLPFINGECVFKSEKHIEEIMSLIFGLQNHIITELNAKSYEPLYKKYNINNEDEYVLATKWAKGYMFGSISAHQEIFSSKSIKKIISPIIALASGIAGTEWEKEKKSSISDLVSISCEIVNELFTVFCDMRVNNLKNIIGANKPAAKGKKSNRNETCHCGSGKKFKKCCFVS